MEVLASQEIDNPIPISSEFDPARGEPTRRSITPQISCEIRFTTSPEISLLSQIAQFDSVRQAESPQSIILTITSHKNVRTYYLYSVSEASH
jgi:hypothetical protein